MKYNSDRILMYILVYCHKVVIIYCSRSQTLQFLLLHTGLYVAMIVYLKCAMNWVIVEVKDRSRSNCEISRINLYSNILCIVHNIFFLSLVGVK